ncbi:ribonuclease H2 subunit A-like isoform X1 [Homarus americanus]|uniref:ribonuclease H2 subunit A-like isoform X1 n=1 Tax=Homarus americanus TaxID=6706 RepID=UPI001C47A4B0|nr:ribonuclease H2 subunit A-like isoform X1 [Homarus americanus]
MDLATYSDKNWVNTFVDSTIPDICKEEPCVLGVDEAGRGPVLGPMVYGICFCPVSKHEDLKAAGVADSKTLSEEQREKIFSIMHENSDYIGWSLEVISPLNISNSMYKRPKVSLNEVSHNAAIGLIKRAIAAGVKVSEVYVDTVGPPEKYQAKLQDVFPTIKVIVEKKADALFPCVSGASICAKVARDRALKKWEFPEGTEVDNWGSGYPGDAVTKNFLMNSIDRVFGFPGIVRFSWSTAEKIIDEKCVPVTWNDEDEEDEKDKTPSVLQFFARKHKSSDGGSAAPPPPKKRHHFFTERCLKSVESF